jgi:hypothetical protein
LVAINIDVLTALILTAVTSALVTAFSYFIASWVPWHTGNWYRAEIYQERDDGKLYQVAAKRPALGKQSFNVGKDYEFLIPDPAPVLFYYNGRPVLQYVLGKARPRHTTLTKDGKPRRFPVSPETAEIKTPPNLRKALPNGAPNPADKDKLPDTESRSVSLFFRREGIKQMIQATRGTSLAGALPLILLAAGVAFMLGYVIFLNVHPGLVQAPPVGYYYKALPIPTNATVPAP